MIVKKYQIEELKEARELQRKCVDLHLPSPPVLHWKYSIQNDDKIIEEGIGKANSYTRNALNMLAYFVGMASTSLVTTSYGDGSLALKSLSGTIGTSLASARYSSSEPGIMLGTGAEGYGLDVYNIIPIETWSSSNMVSGGVFDNNSRKLILTHSKTFSNTTENNIEITDAVLAVRSTTAWNANSTRIVIHDTLPSPIILEPGQSINWNYIIEVAYPNP